MLVHKLDRNRVHSLRMAFDSRFFINNDNVFDSREFLSNDRDREMAIIPFSSNMEIYFAPELGSDDIEYSTSHLKVGIGLYDFDNYTQIIKNSFYLFELYYFDDRVGYIFIPLSDYGFIGGNTTPTNINAFAFVEVWAEYLSNITARLKLFNSVDGTSTEFMDLSGNTEFIGNVDLSVPSLEILDIGKVFQIRNADEENAPSGNDPIAPYTDASAMGNLQTENGKIILVPKLDCNIEYIITNDC